jgi:lactate dehydrogenase-like 2-hydroxyacid dehydrogenase
MKHKIVSFVSSSPDSLIDYFKDLPNPPEIIAPGTKAHVTEEQACKAVQDATIILSFPFSPYLNRKILESAKKVKLIQFATVGYDNIDLKTASELGIPVANNPGWNAISVAEHTIMLILMTLKKTLKSINKFIDIGYTMAERRAAWNETWELFGKQVGLIGFGSIGQIVAKYANAFGANVLYTKRTRLSHEEEEKLGVEYRNLGDLLKESDIVSIHVPLTEETHNLVNANNIGLMKTGAVLINTSRAEIVDEKATVEALRNGKLSGYGADVVTSKLENNYSLPDSPLVGLSNVVLTPHNAGPTREAVARSRRQYMENIRRYILGELPLYIVNNL